MPSPPDISKIEMTDSSTVMNFKVRYYPKYWVQLAEKTYIEADGEKYYMVSADGITPGERLWIPESGEAEFTLVFPPIPASVKKIILEGARGSFGCRHHNC